MNIFRSIFTTEKEANPRNVRVTFHIYMNVSSLLALHQLSRRCPLTSAKVYRTSKYDGYKYINLETCARERNLISIHGGTELRWRFSSALTFLISQSFSPCTDLRVVSGGFAVTGVVVLHLVEPARNLSSPIRLAVIRSRGPGRPCTSDVLSHRESTCESIANLQSINVYRRERTLKRA